MNYISNDQALKICHLKNRSGDPNYKSLVDSIERGVRLAVGEKHWMRSRAIQIRSLGKREPHPVSNNVQPAIKKKRTESVHEK